MTSNRPYLVRAISEWIIDNHLTPYLLVAADGAQVPEQYVKDGKIVLNISPVAVKGLEINNSDITFSARFDGSPFYLMIPIENVIAVYAKENGMGMLFPEEEAGIEEQTGDKPRMQKAPHLKVVK